MKLSLEAQAWQQEKEKGLRGWWWVPSAQHSMNLLRVYLQALWEQL